MTGSSRKHQEGIVVLLVVLILSVLAFVFIAGQFMMTSEKDTKQQLNVTAQSDNVARAGLTDAINWFRNQSSQPVRSSSNPTLYTYPDAAFSPLYSNGDTTDTACTGLVGNTCSGLIKEYPVGQNTILWAHYEVLRQQDPSVNPVNAHAVHDITASRLQGQSNGEGLAWYIESVGYVYHQYNSSVPYNQPPNQIVAHSRVATEIRRVALTLPANAAVIVNNRTQVTLNSNGRIVGNTGNIGLGYYTGSSGPTISGSGAQCTGTWGTQNITSSSSTAVNFQQIFGLNPQDLKLMADYDINAVNPMPSTYPSMAIVYVEQDVTFNTVPLQGGGILIVNGNLTIPAGTSPLFSGVIYVAGNVSISGDALISGSLIATGSVTISGSGGVAEVAYDNTIINSVRQQIGEYRENKAAYYTFSALQ